jgi:hypothetical protein
VQRKDLLRPQVAVRVLVMALLIVAGLIKGVGPTSPALAPRSDALEWGQELLRLRTRLLVEGGDGGTLQAFYDTESMGGAWALEKEQRRLAYLKQWAELRKVKFTRGEVEFTRVSVEASGEDAGVSICAHTRLTYCHLDRPIPGEDTLGWRTVHWMELHKEEGDWRLTAEWYLDPLEAASRNPEVAPSTANIKLVRSEAEQVLTSGGYRRAEAVRYADRYAGIKIGDGMGRYNPKYRDFAGVGGDCANFVSQALTDEEGGNLPTDWGWFYAGGEGTEAWLKAEAMVYHLLDTGRAVCLASGSLAEVTTPSSEYPHGALQALLPGDIIAYEEGGEIVHVSLVVGRDSGGYVLVNSHSADRYRVPWDLGYGSDIEYWLLSIQG